MEKVTGSSPVGSTRLRRCYATDYAWLRRSENKPDKIEKQRRRLPGEGAAEQPEDRPSLEPSERVGMRGKMSAGRGALLRNGLRLARRPGNKPDKNEKRRRRPRGPTVHWFDADCRKLPNYMPFTSVLSSSGRGLKYDPTLSHNHSL